MIYYNSLYQSLKKVSAEWHAGHIEWFYTWNYLKIYEDGVFIYASIAGNDFKSINENFERGAPNITHGKFNFLKMHLLKFAFDNIEVNGFINNDASIIIEGKNAWDIYCPVG